MMSDDTSKQGREPAPDRDKPENDKPGEDKPGEDKLDKSRTPGDGTLDGSVPAGLTSEELRKRAEDDRPTEPGTG